MDMKLIIVTLFCLMFMGIAATSYAQYTVVSSDTKIPEVMLQLELRDSNGHLITYVEAKQIIVIDPLRLNTFLENQKFRPVYNFNLIWKQKDRRWCKSFSIKETYIKTIKILKNI